MGEHIIPAAQDGINAIIAIVMSMASFHFPGTDIPVILVLIAPWGVYFIWKWWLSQIFDIEAKK